MNKIKFFLCLLFLSLMPFEAVAASKVQQSWQILLEAIRKPKTSPSKLGHFFRNLKETGEVGKYKRILMEIIDDSLSAQSLKSSNMSFSLKRFMRDMNYDTHRIKEALDTLDILKKNALNSSDPKYYDEYASVVRQFTQSNFRGSKYVGSVGVIDALTDIRKNPDIFGAFDKVILEPKIINGKVQDFDIKLEDGTLLEIKRTTDPDYVLDRTVQQQVNNIQRILSKYKGKPTDAANKINELFKEKPLQIRVYSYKEDVINLDKNIFAKTMKQKMNKIVKNQEVDVGEAIEGFYKNISLEIVPKVRGAATL